MIVIVLGLIFLFGITIHYYYQKNINNKHIYKFESIKECCVLFDCTLIKYKDAKRTIENMPENLIHIFTKYGFSLFIYNGNKYAQEIKKYSNKGTASAGIFMPEQKRIYINSSHNNIQNTIYHEFGHFCDFLRGQNYYFSEQDEKINNILEKNKIFNIYRIDEYYLVSPQEFIAHIISYELERSRRMPEELHSLAKEYLDFSYF